MARFIVSTPKKCPREIVATFKEMYDADVSATLIPKVTDAVMEQVVEWQSRLWMLFTPLSI